MMIFFLCSLLKAEQKADCNAEIKAGSPHKCSRFSRTNNFVFAGAIVLLVVRFFILSPRAMSQLAILCRLASGLVCTSKLVSQSVSYLRAAIL